MKYALLAIMFLSFAVAEANVKTYIMKCESNEDTLAINWKDAELRADKQPSRGLYQFYWLTWIKYAKIYKIIPEYANLTIEQVNVFLHDPVYNAAVAHGMIDDGLYGHWQNCYDRYLQ